MKPNRKPTLVGVAPKAPAALTPLPTDPYERAVFVTVYADTLDLEYDHDWALHRAHTAVDAERLIHAALDAPAQGLPIGPK